MEVINIRKVKEIMYDTYLVINNNGYYGLMKMGRKLTSTIYEECEFDGTNLFFRNCNLEAYKNIRVNLIEFLRYYLNLLKDEKVNASNVIEKLKNVIPSDIDFLVTSNEYDIINEHVIIFKNNCCFIVCDLNNLESLIPINICHEGYEIVNNQVLLFKDIVCCHIYDMKNQKYLVLYGDINEDGVFLTDKEKNFYDMRNGFFLSKSYSDGAVRCCCNVLDFIIINDKLYYARSKGNKSDEKITGVYDLNEAENREDEKFIELKKLNVSYDASFILESKEGEKVFDECVKSIVEIDRDVAEKLHIDMKFIDCVDELAEDVLYLIWMIYILDRRME